MYCDVSFIHYNLSYINIPYANLSKGNFYKTNFNSANLNGCLFIDSILSGSDFTNANLKDISFGEDIIKFKTTFKAEYVQYNES